MIVRTGRTVWGSDGPWRRPGEKLCTEPSRHVSQLWARLGQSTVEEFATAALASGLSFVVFLEPYEALTNASLAALTAECKAHSTANLTLFAGFTIDTNIGDRTNHVSLFLALAFVGPAKRDQTSSSTGDHYYAFGLGVELPPPSIVDSSSRLMTQPTDPNAPKNFTGYNGPSFAWLLAPIRECCRVLS